MVQGTAATELLTEFFSSGQADPADLDIEAVAFGTWRHQARDGRREPVVLVRTGQDCFEIHAHGGRAVVESIVGGLCSRGGCEQIAAEVLGGGRSPSIASLESRLIQAGGRRAAQILSRQLAGRFGADIHRLERLYESAAVGQAAAVAEAGEMLRRLDRAARIGLRLPSPWRVVLRGPVNVGKSSLVNALAGYARSLVSPLAGTTRDVLETSLILDGWELELMDTAGTREPAGAPGGSIEQAGIARGQAAAATADLVLDLLPAIAIEAEATPAVTGSSRRLLVGTKADLLSDAARDKLAGQVLLTSARFGAGLEQLAAAMIEQLVPEAAAGFLDGGVPVTAAERLALQQLQQRFDQLAVTPDSTGREPEA